MTSQAPPVTFDTPRAFTGYTLTTRSGGAVDRGPDPYAWEREALCAQVDPDLWFPNKGESTREAKAICHRCPVKAECLEAALSEPGIHYGIRGGLSERQRRVLRKARA